MSVEHVAAVVVSFYPTSEVKARLLRYAQFIDRVIVVDNSEPAAFAGSDFPAGNVVYLPLHSNMGVAHALNVGTRHAARLGHRLAVLLDQDSELDATELARAISCARPNHGITALRQVVRKRDRGNMSDTTASPIRDVDTTMTSGSVLNLDAFVRCGEFECKLFIDYVDHDYCLRLKNCGFRIVECEAASLDHALGEVVAVNVLGIAARFNSHQPFRLYYITRNGLYLVAKHGWRYPSAALRVFEVLAKELFKSAFLETEKRRRMAFMARGFRDWMRSRYGRLEWRG